MKLLIGIFVNHIILLVDIIMIHTVWYYWILVVCFLLGYSLAPEFYMPTFRNTVFYLHGQVGVFFTHLPACEYGTECSETSEYKIQTPGNDPEESTEHSEHGESLKSRILDNFFPS